MIEINLKEIHKSKMDLRSSKQNGIAKLFAQCVIQGKYANVGFKANSCSKSNWSICHQCIANLVFVPSLLKKQTQIRILFQ